MALGLVEVRHTRSHRGLGLFATSALSDGTWLGEYTGEVLSAAEYEGRYPAEDAEYVFAASAEHNIDAASPARSGFLRYVNHSARPNVMAAVVRVRRVRGGKRVHLYAARDVSAGEELLLDYGEGDWAGREAGECVG